MDQKLQLHSRFKLFPALPICGAAIILVLLFTGDAWACPGCLMQSLRSYIPGLASTRVVLKCWTLAALLIWGWQWMRASDGTLGRMVLGYWLCLITGLEYAMALMPAVLLVVLLRMIYMRVTGKLAGQSVSDQEKQIKADPFFELMLGLAAPVLLLIADFFLSHFVTLILPGLVGVIGTAILLHPKFDRQSGFLMRSILGLTCLFGFWVSIPPLNVCAVEFWAHGNGFWNLLGDGLPLREWYSAAAWAAPCWLCIIGLGLILGAAMQRRWWNASAFGVICVAALSFLITTQPNYWRALLNL